MTLKDLENSPRAEPDLGAPAPSPPAEEIASLRGGRGQVLLGTLTLGHFSHHVGNSLLNPLLPLIRDSFTLSYAQSGFLVSAFSLSLGLSNAPIGFLADRVGSRPVIVGGLVLTGLASAALALAGAYWQLLVLLVVMGIIAGSYHAPSSALLAQTFATRVRGTAMGIHITGGHLSFFATPLLAALVVGAVGTWRAPYLWFALAPVLAGGLIWFLTPRLQARPAAKAPPGAVFRELGAVVRLVGPLVSISVLFQMAYAALMAFFTLYLVDARGLEPALAAALFGAPHLVGILGAPLGGYLSDRFGRRAVILIGIGGLGPAFWALTLVPNELILLPLAGIGLAGALRQTVTEVLVTESAPAHRRATFLGGYYMLSQELGGLAAPLLGLLASLAGIAAAFNTVGLALAVLSLAVVAAQRAFR